MHIFRQRQSWQTAHICTNNTQMRVIIISSTSCHGRRIQLARYDFLLVFYRLDFRFRWNCCQVISQVSRRIIPTTRSTTRRTSQSISLRTTFAGNRRLKTYDVNVSEKKYKNVSLETCTTKSKIANNFASVCIEHFSPP